MYLYFYIPAGTPRKRCSTFDLWPRAWGLKWRLLQISHNDFFNISKKMVLKTLQVYLYFYIPAGTPRKRCSTFDLWPRAWGLKSSELLCEAAAEAAAEAELQTASYLEKVKIFQQRYSFESWKNSKKISCLSHFLTNSQFKILNFHEFYNKSKTSHNC